MVSLVNFSDLQGLAGRVERDTVDQGVPVVRPAMPMVFRRRIGPTAVSSSTPTETAMIANGTAPPPVSAAGEASAPDWFSRGRVAREARAAAAAARAVEESRTDGELSLAERITRWIVGGAAAGYGISLLFHLILLALFSVFVLHLGSGGDTVSTELGIVEEPGEEMLDTRAFEISSGMEGAEEPVATVEPVPIEAPDIDIEIATAIAPEMKGAADGVGEDAKTSPGAGDDLVFQLPKGGKTVQQGSFAAWTVPGDPRPGQDYAIVVEVMLPDKTERYLRTDLTGQLIGTDGYKVTIPDGREWNGLGWLRPRRTPLFNRQGEKARIVFFVRGAQQALVRDTIQIRSNLLNEQQKLQIVF